jgi:hypothetical protein
MQSAKSKIFLFCALILAFSITGLFAQNGLDDVRLFQSYFYDTPISKTNHVEGGFQYDSYDGFSSLAIGARGGYPVNDKLEIQAGMNYLSWSPDKGDGESGLSDLAIFGRYSLSNSSETNISVGGTVTLPIGSEDVGQGDLDFGGFGAIRHALESGMVIIGSVALIFYETEEYEVNTTTFEVEEKTAYNSSFNISGGVIYPVNDQLNVVGELAILSEMDYMMLSGGVDYNLGSGRLRAALGIGLDDGAPDIMLMGGYAVNLSK